MAVTYTIDASVFVNAFNLGEVGHDTSLAFLSAARAEGASMIAPTLLLAEVAGAIARGRQDTAVARSLALDIGRLSTLIMVPLDRTLANESADVAIERRVRGADAVYAAVALRFGSTLVTLDREQRERLAPVLTTKSPEEMLAELGGESS
ncbi:MAG TPA: type II toxin-antitoxin system VapC family toxin [Dehalococcoidia bacterium]|nr:type II toxin-antitoxin system VapC family toxin [Dehalococcoidia bacterium]